MKKLKLNAYTDETGNTGLNIFDENQPYFWTGTILSVADLDQVGKQQLNVWLTKLGVNELHGNQLGISKIDVIADDIFQFLLRYNCKLIFTRVEKQHVAGTKFVDQILDPGLNKGVTYLQYGPRPLRIILAATIIRNLDLQMNRCFWQAYQTADEKLFSTFLYELRKRVIRNVKDDRSKEILTDAIKVALINPRPFLTETLMPEEAPNLVAFSMIFNAVREEFDGIDVEISKFVHDEQNQFAKSIECFYDVHRRIELDFIWFGKLKEHELAKCPVKMLSSHNSVALQIIDVLLWLMKRHVDGNDVLLAASQRLLDKLVPLLHISEFTKAQLFYEADQWYRHIMTMPLTKGQEEYSQKLISEMEVKRQRRMQGLDYEA